jgi:hypothetical protein
VATSLPYDTWVEWAPDYGINDDVPDPAGWVRIVLPLRQLSTARGVQRAVGRVEAGEFEVLMGDPTRAFDPHNRQGPNWAALQGRHPVRIRAQASAVSSARTLIRGWSTNWVADWNLLDVTVRLTGLDVLAALGKQITGTVFDRDVAALAPAYWLALAEGGGLVANARAGPPGVATNTTGGPPLMPYGDQPSISMPQPGSRVDVSVGSIVVPQAFSVFVIVSGTGRGAVQCIFSAGSYDVANTPFGDVALVLNDPAGTIPNTTLYIGNNAGVERYILQGSNNEIPTMYELRVSPTTWEMSTTIGEGIGSSGPQPRVGPQVPRAGGLRIGNIMQPSADLPFDGAIANFMMWNRTLTDAERNTLLLGFVRPQRDRYSSTQVSWILDDLGIPAARRNIETGLQLMGSLRLGAPAAEILGRIAATERGRFFADRRGIFYFHNRDHVGVDKGTYDTRPAAGSTDIALADITPTADDRTFATVAVTQVATPAPIDVEYRHPNADLYGEVSSPQETQFRNKEEAFDGAVAMVGDGTPGLDIVGAKIVGGAFNVDWDWTLTLDVSDHAVFVGRIPSSEDGPVGAFMQWGVGPFWSVRRLDSFTRADAAVLGATEGEQSEAWTITGGVWSIAGNRVKRTTAANTHHQATLTTTVTDHEITALLATLSGTVGYSGLVARFVDTNNHYLLVTDPAPGMALYRKVAGLYTLLGTWVGNPLGHRWSLRAVGPLITGLRDDVVVFSVVDTTLTTGTRAGLNSFNYAAGDDERFDDVDVHSYPWRGWAGPPPIQRAAKVLYVRHDADFADKTWVTTLDLEGID